MGGSGRGDFFIEKKVEIKKVGRNLKVWKGPHEHILIDETQRYLL